MVPPLRFAPDGITVRTLCLSDCIENQRQGSARVHDPLCPLGQIPRHGSTLVERRPKAEFSRYGLKMVGQRRFRNVPAEKPDYRPLVVLLLVSISVCVRDTNRIPDVVERFRDKRIKCFDLLWTHASS